MSLALNPRFRFETFVVGAANRLAATAARAVAESPGVVYNPLFIYGGPGLGKTHLLMAVAQAAKAISPSLAIAYQTLDDFVEAFHAAIAAGQGEAYRRRFADLDLLLLDDVQFLSRRREMQSELLRLVNAMQTAGRQIVLTSDRAPSEIESLDERLIGRFAGGLVIDVSAPDYETRMAILRRQAESRELVFAPGVLEAAASMDVANIRELLGAFNRLIAWQAAHDEPLGAETARGLLRTAEGPPADSSTPDDEAGPLLGTPPEGDEFGMFLTEITTTVSRQLEQWRTRVGEAILRWEGEGYRVTRLQELFEDPDARDIEAELAGFASDITRLRELEREAAEWDPAVTADPVFHDPDRLTDAEAAVERARDGGGPLPGPSPHWRLEGFEEVDDNRVATRAAAAVIADPGQHYNPLVLVGPEGTGKTHLLHAIGNALAVRQDAVVACMSAREFVDDLIDAIDRDRVAWWRRRYRRVTAFLLDDIHLLEGTDRTQEELFWLFNALHEDGRQMVFTARGALDGLAPRLASRLEGGLIAELPPPGRTVREAVAARLLSADGGAVDAELPGYLAARADDGIRALQETVERVHAAAAERSTELTAALAREVLEGASARPPVKRSGTRTSGVVGRGGILSR
ncbi:MAG: DnaA ATPase domain-containing protein, partial [Gemmatimonadales bacterium]